MTFSPHDSLAAIGSIVFPGFVVFLYHEFPKSTSLKDVHLAPYWFDDLGDVDGIQCRRRGLEGISPTSIGVRRGISLGAGSFDRQLQDDARSLCDRSYLFGKGRSRTL